MFLLKKYKVFIILISIFYFFISLIINNYTPEKNYDFQKIYILNYEVDSNDNEMSINSLNVAAGNAMRIYCIANCPGIYARLQDMFKDIIDFEFKSNDLYKFDIFWAKDKIYNKPLRIELMECLNQEICDNDAKYIFQEAKKRFERELTAHFSYIIDNLNISKNMPSVVEKKNEYDEIINYLTEIKNSQITTTVDNYNLRLIKYIPQNFFYDPSGKILSKNPLKFSAYRDHFYAIPNIIKAIFFFLISSLITYFLISIFEKVRNK